jgi:hypothetical protein
MIIRKTDPQMIDVLIDSLQVHLDSELNGILGNWENNHRAYKNPKSNSQNGLIAEVYTERGNYRECFFDDRFTTTSFFITSDTTTFQEKVPNQTISWILQTKINTIYPTVTHRADEELRNEVLKAFKSFRGRIELDSIETGIDNVYREFNTEKLKYDSMSNVFVLRVNMLGKFDTTCCFDC